MNLNRTIPRIGAAVAAAAVFLFAICLIIDFTFGSYTVCMFLPIGYIMMAAGFHHECAEDRKTACFLPIGVPAYRRFGGRRRKAETCAGFSVPTAASV